MKHASNIQNRAKAGHRQADLLENYNRGILLKLSISTSHFFWLLDMGEKIFFSISCTKSFDKMIGKREFQSIKKAI